MCHVFRCDSAPAKDIANALKETCRRVIAEKNKSSHTTNNHHPSAGPSGGSNMVTSSTCDSINRLMGLKRPNFLPDISVNTSKVDINLKLRSISYNKEMNECASGSAATAVANENDSAMSHSIPLTPMDEPCKKHSCKYLGNMLVNKPYGMDVLNDAIDTIYTRALENYKKLKREKKLRRQRKLQLLNKGINIYLSFIEFN